MGKNSDGRVTVSQGVESRIMFFHVCTDGAHNGVVHFEDADYKQASIICSVNAHKNGVRIVAFCHMSTHSHFVIYASSLGQAIAFAEDFKRDYAKYVSFQHGVRKVYNEVNCTPKLIGDLRYLKNCIAYTLLNPVAAGMVKRPEEYRWSSFDAYFNNSPDTARKICGMTVRERRSVLRTRIDVGNSSLAVADDGSVSLKSFVDYRFVEKLFRSKTDFYKALALTDSIAEEERFVRSYFTYSDTEVIAEALTMARMKFAKESLTMLTKDEKHALLLPLRKKTRATPNKLARIFRLPESEIRALLGLPQER